MLRKINELYVNVLFPSVVPLVLVAVYPGWHPSVTVFVEYSLRLFDAWSNFASNVNTALCRNLQTKEFLIYLFTFSPSESLNVVLCFPLFFHFFSFGFLLISLFPPSAVFVLRIKSEPLSFVNKLFKKRGK